MAVSFEKLKTDPQDAPERIYYSVSDEDETDTVSFIDLDTKNPKVQSNGGQASLKVVSDDGNKITLLNTGQAGAEGAELYTIFRNKGVVIYTQQIDAALIGPFGALEMGYCN